MRARVNICPNPECQKKIEEPILLNNLSTTPAEQYYACPYCLIKLTVSATRRNRVSLIPIALGSIILVSIGYLTWYDMTMWGKDIALIFFGSRTGEAISLGIGIRVIHYFLIGSTLLILGFATSLRRRSKAIELYLGEITPEKEKGPSECPYHFGYLKKFDRNIPIPKGCLKCNRMQECFGSIEQS